MSQAKTLTAKDLKKVLAYIDTRKHASRNRCMLFMTHWAGMRVGEVAALTLRNVLAADGQIRDEINLTAAQTKGGRGRVVLIPQKLQQELKLYLRSRHGATRPLTGFGEEELDRPLFYTQKRAGFNANTLCQHFFSLYRAAGLEGASSHSGRRSFITNLAHKGVGVRVLMDLAGHRNISTTQRYIDCNEVVKRSAVELV